MTRSIQSSRVLVTGGAGFLGSHVVEDLEGGPAAVGPQAVEACLVGALQTGEDVPPRALEPVEALLDLLIHRSPLRPLRSDGPG